jgi:hypothetical protein
MTVSAGGIAVTGNSTITGTLGGLTGLTVASGGASITGNSTITGTLTGLTGLTVASGGETITAGGLTVSAGGVNVTGNSVFKPSSDSTTAFQVQNAAATTTVLNIDTTNGRLGVGTAAPSRPIDVAINNSLTTAPMALLEQAGTGNATLEFKTPAKSFIVGQDGSDASKFKVSSSTASSSPTLYGKSTVGAARDSQDQNAMNCVKYTTGGLSGTAASISIYVKGGVDAANKSFQGAIYTDNGSGTSPTTLLASSTSGTLAPDAWNTATITASLSASTIYWLCANNNSGIDTLNNWAYDDAAGSAAFKAQTFGTWPASFGTGTGTTTQFSFYVTYTPSGTYNSFAKSLLTLSETGQAAFQNSTDSITAFQIQNAASTTVLNVDTTNGRVGVGNTAPAATFDVTGSLKQSGGALTLQGNATSSLATTIGTLTLQGAGGVTMNTTDSTSASTNGITIQSGSATVGSNLNAGTVSIDTGTKTGAGTAILNLGNTNALTINIGNGSVANTINIGAVTNDVAGTVNLNTATSGAATRTTTIGSNVGASNTTIYGGTGNINLNSNSASAGTKVTSSTNSSTAFQIMNASSQALFRADTANTVLGLVDSHPGTLPTPTTAANSITAAYGFGSVMVNGFIYRIGGCDGAGANTNTVQYTRLRADGSVGGWASGTALPVASCYNAVATYNNLIYVTGGTSAVGTSSNVYFVQVNGDGSLGTWKTASTAIPQDVIHHSMVAYNGWLYIMGGSNLAGTNNHNLYRTALSYYSGVGAFTTQTGWLPGTPSATSGQVDAAVAVANGYLYLLGSTNASNATTATYAKMNSAGDVAASATTTALPAGRAHMGAAVLNGYIYLLGGIVGGVQTNSIIYSSLTTSNVGLLGSWTTNTNNLPAVRSDGGVTVANGYIYYSGGTSSGTTAQTAVYYTSPARIQAGATLDLLAYNGSNGLSESGTGGNLTAGNTIVAGTLNVTDQALFKDNATVTGKFQVQGDTTLGPTTISGGAFYGSGLAISANAGNASGVLFYDGTVSHGALGTAIVGGDWSSGSVGGDLVLSGGSTYGLSLGSGAGVRLRFDSAGVPYLPGLASLAGTYNLLCVNSSGGDVKMGTTTSCASSSARYKENIQTMQDKMGLEAINALRPVTFNYKIGPDRTSKIGLIAEEVQQVLPDVVAYDKDGRPDSVNYEFMVANLIKGIQQQQVQINNLRTGLWSGGLVSNDTTFASLVTFNAGVRFKSDATFDGNTTFNGSVTVNSSTAGSVTIPRGTTELVVNFKQPYLAIPNVTATASDFVALRIQEKTPRSFKIVLAQPQARDISVDWIALQAQINP